MIKISLFAFLVSVFLYSSSYAQEESQNIIKVGKTDDVFFQVPHTQVELIPPAHFQFMEEINGFLHIGTSASVQVQEITGTAYVMVTEGLTEDYFQQQGVQKISKEEVVTKHGAKGVIYKVAFEVDDKAFERLMFFTGDYHRTIWINANYPVIIKELMYIVLRESLLTARFVE